MKTRNLYFVAALTALVAALSCSKNEGPVPEAVSHKDTYEEAYVYGFPMVMNYGVMYAYFVDKNSGQYKAPFNQIYNEARVFTPKDTAIITPNSDTHTHSLGRTCGLNPSFSACPRSRRAGITMFNSSTCTRSTTDTSVAAPRATMLAASWSLGRIGRAIHHRGSRRYFIPRRSLV